MKIITSVLLLCLAVAIDASPRIIGGNDAPDGKYPYMASLKNLGRHFCGGSILDQRWILTAAHCLVGYPNPKYITVHVGSNKLSGGNVQVYQAEYTTYHDDYDSDMMINDIGLVRVDRDIVFGPKVQPIVLADKDDFDDDSTAVLSGWGRTSTSARSVNNLQEIGLQLISQEACNKTWSTEKPPITKSHICTRTQVGEGTCYGDSGSPLVVDGVQVGIASFVSCSEEVSKETPGVFTRVFTFLDWIDDQQREFE